MVMTPTMMDCIIVIHIHQLRTGIVLNHGVYGPGIRGDFLICRK